MLTLFRRVGSRTFIGADAVVEIVQIDTHSVKVKIEAQGTSIVRAIGLREAYPMTPTVTLKVLSIEDDQLMRLGVEAPPGIKVRRDDDERPERAGRRQGATPRPRRGGRT